MELQDERFDAEDEVFPSPQGDTEPGPLQGLVGSVWKRMRELLYQNIWEPFLSVTNGMGFWTLTLCIVAVVYLL